LAVKGAAFLDEQLFNGEYYQQKIQWQDLHDKSLAEHLAQKDHPNPRMQQLLAAEGPKYQYGRGCLSDGVIGAWMARIYGLATPLTQANVKNTLAAIFRHNFRKDLFDHACTQRPGYAIGHESGLLLCTWPHGSKPTLPFPYSDEVWTGIEYQVASHLIEEGLVEEGLAIVRAVRARYEGHTRNPFNEYECGSYYARAMSSYAVLNSLAGLRYSAVTRTLYLAPKLTERPFRCFLSTATGYGTVTLEPSALILELLEGELKIDSVELCLGGKTATIPWNFSARTGRSILRVPNL